MGRDGMGEADEDADFWHDAPLTLDELESVLTWEDALLLPRATLHEALETVFNWASWLGEARPATVNECLQALLDDPDVAADCKAAVDVLQEAGSRERRLFPLLEAVLGRVPDTELPETGLPLHADPTDLEVVARLPPWVNAWMRLASDEAGMSQTNFMSAIVPCLVLDRREFQEEAQRAIHRAGSLTEQARHADRERALQLLAESRRELAKADVQLARDDSERTTSAASWTRSNTRTPRKPS